jgi:tRNA threonylcarbamoyladenosine biosynthesis protein TsaE
MKFVSKNQKQTQEFAGNLARKFDQGKIVALYGDLGAGKTTFVQGFAKGLGIEKRIISPTFVILRSYVGKKFNFHHIDLYRLDSEQDIIDQGILDLFDDPKNIIAIEWAEKMEKILPKNLIKITLKYMNEKEREIDVR